MVEKPETLEFNIVPVVFSLVVALGGLAFGWLVYGAQPLQAGQTDPVEKLGPLFKFLHNRWYWDELYRKLFINPLQKIADAYTSVVDKGVIDRILKGYIAAAQRSPARLPRSTKTSSPASPTRSARPSARPAIGAATCKVVRCKTICSLAL